MSNISTNVNVSRIVNLDLNNYELTGNVNFATDQAGKIELGKGKVSGNLTVKTPAVSFYNLATVTGVTTIEDVANNTFTNNGSLQTVLLQDPNGTRFVNGVSGTIAQDLTVDTTGIVALSGVFPKVIAKKAVKLILVNNAQITNLNTLQGVIATVSGGTVLETTGSGTVDIKEDTIKYPQVTIKKNATYRVLKGEGKDAKNYYGVQARFTLPADQHGLIKESDKVVVSLMQGDKILSTSTSKDSGNLLLSKYFNNEYANEKFYASTLFTPNDTYPSGSWDTTKWTATPADKPNRLKVEIKRNDKIVSSSVSSLELDETFTDGISKSPLTWSDILEENDAAVKSAILAVNTAPDASALKSLVEKDEVLKLDLTDYNSLTKPDDKDKDYGVGDRQMAVITDILANQVSKEAKDHWTVKQFRELFAAAVETRVATQKALYSVNSADSVEKLDVDAFLDTVGEAYKKNQNVLVKATNVKDTSIVSEQLLLAAANFKKLEDTKKEALLKAVYNDGENYSSWGAMAEVFFNEFKNVNS